MYTQELKQDSATSEEAFESVKLQRDAQLVEQARYGSREAFSELVRRHRDRALGWANSLTYDGQLAEDIVQEALISAFLKIETLMEPDRFKYWLKRIVRNQAMMKLRRGGPHGKESPLSGLERERPAEGSEPNDSLLDRLLFQMSNRWNDPSVNDDPEVRLMRKDLYEGLYQLLRCLSPRERNIFEAHVFRQLSPAEIGEALNVSVGSVYTAISRSRAKVQRERIRVYFQGYLQEKKRAGESTRRILATPIKM